MGKKPKQLILPCIMKNWALMKKKHTATLLKYNIKILDLDNLGSESGTHENNL